ncbi:hypothetical protein EV424DRAFT_1352226 [Suillus variegatus]|nr:hypothetical protein EV424DRAFT_1352226 [Suillus variegatus]
MTMHKPGLVRVTTCLCHLSLFHWALICRVVSKVDGATTEDGANGQEARCSYIGILSQKSPIQDILLSTAVPDGHIGLPHARHLVYGVSCHVKEFSGLMFVFEVEVLWYGEVNLIFLEFHSPKASQVVGLFIVFIAIVAFDPLQGCHCSSSAHLICYCSQGGAVCDVDPPSVFPLVKGALGLAGPIHVDHGEVLMFVFTSRWGLQSVGWNVNWVIPPMTICTTSLFPSRVGWHRFHLAPRGLRGLGLLSSATQICAPHGFEMGIRLYRLEIRVLVVFGEVDSGIHNIALSSSITSAYAAMVWAKQMGSKMDLFRIKPLWSGCIKIVSPFICHCACALMTMQWTLASCDSSRLRMFKEWYRSFPDMLGVLIIVSGLIGQNA